MKFPKRIQHVSAKEFREALAKSGKKPRYSAHRRAESQLIGRSFMSEGERDCGEMLWAMQQGREIRDLEFQVSVRLTAGRLRWVLDYRFFDAKLSEVVWADFKGHEQERWGELKKLWPHYGPARLRVYKKGRHGIFVAQEIVPRSNETNAAVPAVNQTRKSEG